MDQTALAFSETRWADTGSEEIVNLWEKKPNSA